MKAFIFDLDGTLADTVPLIVATARRVWQEYGLYPDEARIRSFIGVSLFQTGEAVLGPGAARNMWKRTSVIIMRSRAASSRLPACRRCCANCGGRGQSSRSVPRARAQRNGNAAADRHCAAARRRGPQRDDRRA